MNIFKAKFKEDNRRGYIRLNSVFPVEFKLVSIDGKNELSGWLQGFTNNIGKGGLCLDLHTLPEGLIQRIKAKEAKFALRLEMPIAKNPVEAIAAVAWVQEIKEEPERFLIGLQYEKIDSALNLAVTRYARFRHYFTPALLSLIIGLGLVSAAGSYANWKLNRSNAALVEQLVKVMQESGVAKQKAQEFNQEREGLQAKMDLLLSRLEALESEKVKVEEKAESSETQAQEKITQLNSLIDNLGKEKLGLQGQLATLQQKESVVSEELLRLDQRKTALEKANFDKMYQWLVVHQNPRTGLIMSFEGDNDTANWAFLYDQSLAAQAYLIFEDYARAEKIFNFFKVKAKRENSFFYNAYYANDGEPAEYTLHCGPNIWLGIGIMHYTKKTQDTSFLALAEEIAGGIMQLQKLDKDGGIRGGPHAEWFSTEHNLDAYAFFTMLYKLTGNQRYQEAAELTLQWLVKNTYGKADLPVKRGKGDATIATDTYAWSIAAVGPKKLAEIGMDPEKIMDFAESNCAVEVRYARPQGQSVKIKGFDFAPQRHLARGGVVSTEWTAQMIIAFSIMAEYYSRQGLRPKADTFAAKADEYMASLANMIISSPSPSGQGASCLPYATQEFVDTGHGWSTPKGKATGSVSGTAYTIFAYHDYNPLELKE